MTRLDFLDLNDQLLCKNDCNKINGIFRAKKIMLPIVKRLHVLVDDDDVCTTSDYNCLNILSLNVCTFISFFIFLRFRETHKERKICIFHFITTFFLASQAIVSYFTFLISLNKTTFSIVCEMWGKVEVKNSFSLEFFVFTSTSSPKK